MTQTRAAADYLLDALIAQALEQMAAGWPAETIAASLEDNLAWIEAQR